jgi:hypothetical protein
MTRFKKKLNMIHFCRFLCPLLGIRVYAADSEGCKILGFRGGGYEECRLLGCYAVWLL